MNIPGIDNWLTTDPDDREMTVQEIEDLVDNCIEQANGHIERLSIPPDYHGELKTFYGGVMEYLKKEMEGIK